MRRRLLDLVVCPACGEQLTVEATFDERSVAGRDEPEVVDGSLRCAACGALYPVIGGVPRLLARELLAHMVGRYPEYFAAHPEFGLSTEVSSGWSNADPKGATLESFTRQRLDLRPPDRRFATQWVEHLHRVLGPDVADRDLAGRLVVDVGCGFGRHLFAAASLGAEVVGMDLSGGVDLAWRNTLDLPGCHVVQADVFEPPIRAGEFDVAWSFGVLHHLPDPVAGFRQLVRFARPNGGRVAIWVYGYEGMAFTYRLSHLRTLRRILERAGPGPRLLASQAVAAGLTLGWWQPLRLLRRAGMGRRVRRLPLSEHIDHDWPARVAAVHDRLSTPITHYHDRDELLGWFEESGLTDVVVEDTDRRGWRATGRRIAGADSTAPASPG